MKKNVLVLLVALFALTVAASPGWSAVPAQISIQGKLIPAQSPAPAFTFTVNSVLAGKSYADLPAATITYDTTTGIFSCTVDLTGKTDVLALGDATVTIKVGGTAMVTNQPLLSVPYAFRAAVADSLSGGVDATTVTYNNTTYPTVAKALDQLFYVAPGASGFSATPPQAEIGTSVTVNLVWSLAKPTMIPSISTDTVNYTNLTPGQTGYSQGGVNNNTTFDLKVSDGNGNVTPTPATTSISFLYKVFWGISASASPSGVTLSGGKLATGVEGTYPFDGSAGAGYMYIACPTAWTTQPTNFWLGGTGRATGSNDSSNWSNVGTATYSNGNYNIYMYKNQISGPFAYYVY